MSVPDGEVGAGRSSWSRGFIDSSGEIRLLRFRDPEVEREYREFHLTRGLPVYRGLFIFILAFQALLLVTGPVADELPLDDPRLWMRTAFGVTQALVGLWAIRQRWFMRWGEPYMLAQVVVIGLMLATLFGSHPLGFARMMGYLISTVILARLRLRHAVVAMTIEIAAFAAVAVRAAPTPGVPGGLAPRLIALGITGLLLAVAAYMLEHSERRDFLLTRLLLAEQEKSERLLLNVLPEEIAERLKRGDSQVADGFAEVTVLFADIVSFTPTSARWGPGETVRVLNQVFSCFDELCVRHGVEKIKTAGDGYLAVGGVPEPRGDHALAVVALALDLLAEVRKFAWPDGEPVTVRVGIASGPAIAGVIGTRKFTYDVWGDTVSTAARMQQHGAPGVIQMTDATHELVRHRYPGRARQLTVKGKGRMRTWVLEPSHETPAEPAASPRAAARRPRRAPAASRNS